jgi:hypothetical protein
MTKLNRDEITMLLSTGGLIDHCRCAGANRASLRRRHVRHGEGQAVLRPGILIAFLRVMPLCSLQQQVTT